MNGTNDNVQRVVINACFGGFSLSDAAYEKLMEWGVPVRKYMKVPPGPVTKLSGNDPRNEGEVIFDRELDDDDTTLASCTRRLCGRYWETWIDDNRAHPLLIRLVEELGDKASGRYAKLKIIDIPAGVQWEIKEQDGSEHVGKRRAEAAAKTIREQAERIKELTKALVHAVQLSKCTDARKRGPVAEAWKRLLDGTKETS